MTRDDRYRFDAFVLFAAGAFAGANLFIGLSMGTYWLSLDPVTFTETFFAQWLRFLATIMPLFLMSLYGLVRSARRDGSDPAFALLWRRAIQCWVATCLITATFHMPLNLRLGAATFSPEEAAASSLYSVVSVFGSVTADNAGFTRAIWLLGHLPRMVLAIAVALFATRAVLARRQPLGAAHEDRR